MNVGNYQRLPTHPSVCALIRQVVIEMLLGRAGGEDAWAPPFMDLMVAGQDDP